MESLSSWNAESNMNCKTTLVAVLLGACLFQSVEGQIFRRFQRSQPQLQQFRVQPQQYRVAPQQYRIQPQQYQVRPQQFLLNPTQPQARLIQVPVNQARPVQTLPNRTNPAPALLAAQPTRTQQVQLRPPVQPQVPGYTSRTVAVRNQAGCVRYYQHRTPVYGTPAQFLPTQQPSAVVAGRIPTTASDILGAVVIEQASATTETPKQASSKPVSILLRPEDEESVLVEPVLVEPVLVEPVLVEPVLVEPKEKPSEEVFSNFQTAASAEAAAVEAAEEPIAEVETVVPVVPESVPSEEPSDQFDEILPLDENDIPDELFSDDPTTAAPGGFVDPIIED